MIVAAEPTLATETITPSASAVRFRVAGTLEERLAAFRLVYNSYLRKGLIDPNPFRLRVTPFHLLPTTSTYIAYYRNEVICTLTLVGDGMLGLPMESIYPDEVEAIRQQGGCSGEVTCLAVRDVPFRCFLPIFIKLTRLMAQSARAHGIDRLLIATHPKHGRFYCKFMGFEQFGGVREYPSVRNAPAAAYCLDFARIDRDRPACYDQYFGTPLPSDELAYRPMTREEQETLAPVAALSGECVPISA